MLRLSVATDLSDRSDLAVARALELAETHGASLEILHIVDDALPEEMAETVRAKAEATLQSRVAQIGAQSPAPKITVKLGDPATDIAEVATRSDLLIVGRHRERAFDIFRETTVERMVRLVDCPILLVVKKKKSPYAKALAAVDASIACATAIRTVAKIAPEAEITAFLAFHVPYKGLSGATTEELALPFRKEAERELATWLAAHPLPKAMQAPTLFEGGVTDALSTMLREHKPDLLALGAHARSGVSRFLLGHVTADLVRNPPCDLVIARPALRD